jgi:hypothetical protein
MARGKLGVLICLTVAIGVALWQSGAMSSASPVPSIPDTGALTPLSALAGQSQELLGSAGFASDLRLREVASDGVAIYTYKRSDGAVCYLADGSGICPATSEQSLFQGQPIADVMRVGTSANRGGATGTGPLLAWRGLALSGVASVAIVDTNGVHYSTPVIDNAFELRGPIAAPSIFEALDSNGKTLWTKRMNWSP